MVICFHSRHFLPLPSHSFTWSAKAKAFCDSARQWWVWGSCTISSSKYWTEEFVSSKAMLYLVALLLATLLFFLYFQSQNETSVTDGNSHYSKTPSWTFHYLTWNTFFWWRLFNYLSHHCQSQTIVVNHILRLFFYPSCNFDRRVCWTLTNIQTSFDVYWQGDNHRKLVRKFWAQLKSWTDFEYWDQSEEPLVGLFIDSLVWWDGQSKSPLCYSHLFTSAINSSVLSITIIAFIIMLTCFFNQSL